MRTLHIVLPLLCALALGCRVNPGQVLLEQESRLLEDQVWELQGCLEDAHAAREATARENESLKKQLADKGGDTGPTIELKDRPSKRRPGSTGPKLEPPTIELPGASETPSVEMPRDTETPGVELGPADEESAVVEGQPSQLVFNKRLTGGMDRDGAAGDEGIVVAVEPRDEQGNLVKGPGSVSVVVLDPSVEGEASRVARWDFDASEVPRHFTKEKSAPGLQFTLPWPNQPPKNRDLRLYVRYTAPDGSKIVADTPIEFRGPADSPMLSRRGADWSATENVKRPPARPAPASRLRSPRPAPRTAKEAGSGESAGSEAPRWDAGRPGVQPANEPIEQAQRVDRPEWKPYR